MTEPIAILIAAVIGLIGSLVTYYLTASATARSTAKKKDAEWKHKYEPNPIPKGQRKNTILLIGIGRVGKTQLVSYFTSSQPVQKELTNKFSISTCEKTYHNKQGITYYLSDYRGQNFAQLVESFILEQLKPNTYLRYGDINTLILIADIFFEDDDLQKKYVTYNKDRVKDHVTAWNIYALDAAFGLLHQEKLQLVVLLINKIDKLEGGLNEDIKENLLNDFKPLIDSLGQRAKASTAHFEVVFCSAHEGTNLGGVNGLEGKLNRHSWPKNNGKV